MIIAMRTCSPPWSFISVIRCQTLRNHQIQRSPVQLEPDRKPNSIRQPTQARKGVEPPLSPWIEYFDDSQSEIGIISSSVISVTTRLTRPISPDPGPDPHPAPRAFPLILVRPMHPLVTAAIEGCSHPQSLHSECQTMHDPTSSLPVLGQPYVDHLVQ
jgi:hypothetical protein